MSIRLLARACAGLSLSVAALSASAYSNLVVFGDSLSDSGNNAIAFAGMFGGAQNVPGPQIFDNSSHTSFPSSFGTYSNGRVWTQYLAQSLGVTLTPSLAGGTNYAFGGAQTGLDDASGFPPSMRSQVATYLGNVHGVADPNALYVVAGGSNNIRVVVDQLTPGTDVAALSVATSAAYASDIAGQVRDLMQAGAQHVLVLNTPNYGLTPWMNDIGKSAEASALSLAMDTALASALAGSGATTFDMYSYLSNVIGAGSASGFSDLTHACGAAIYACDVATSLFWDGVHPTTLAHEKLAAAVYATAVPEPDTTALLVAGLAVVALGARRRAGVQQR